LKKLWKYKSIRNLLNSFMLWPFYHRDGRIVGYDLLC